MLTKDAIIDLLRTDKRAVARALVVLAARQTADERATEHTRHLNGRGFRPCHARMGTNMAQFFVQRGYLTDKQINYWRQLDKAGNMRIGIYAGQLLEEAQEKAAKKLLAKEQVDGDVGNALERKMVVQEMLDDVMDSDDPTIIEPLANELAALDAFIKKVQGQ
jgi:hypothetical protein